MEWICPECSTVYQRQLGGVGPDGNDCCVHLLPKDGCNCYKCTKTRYMDNGSIKNNMEYHTYGEECDECGEARTKYRDLGTKGRFVCPNCR